MKKSCAILASILLIVFLCACNLQKAVTPAGTNPDTVATNVVLTLTALTQAVQQSPAASPTLASPTFTLTPTQTPTVTITATASVTPTITNTSAPTKTPIPKPGTIAGSISYPYGSVPNLVIVAFGQEPPYNYSYLTTNLGDTFYSMSSQYLVPGKFQVVAYDSSGHTGGCAVIVTVISEQTVNCDITDWGGSYPSKPSGVP
jgi:hypothetical protein